MSRSLPIPAYRYNKKYSTKLVILPAIVSTLVILAIGVIIFLSPGLSRQNTFLLIIGCGVILVWLLTYFIIRNQTKPIQTITDALLEFAGGDWNRRINLKSNDEFGLIAFTFNHMASELSQNYFSLNTGRLNINQVITAENGIIKLGEVYKTIRAITKANSREEILNVLHNFSSRLPYTCYVLEADNNGYSLSGFYPKNTSGYHSPQSFIPLLPDDATQIFKNHPYKYFSKSDSQIAIPLQEFVNQIPSQAIYLFPIHSESSIIAILGVCIEPQLDNDSDLLMSLQAISKIASDLITKFAQGRKSGALEDGRKKDTPHLDQGFSEISLTDACKTIHQQVRESMGDVLFYVALFDEASNQIEIPYIYDPTSEINEIPPMPMGSGLTSIVIRSKQPLMLVEDTENKARALGARTMGTPAKSWLGVPIISGESVLGAIIVQDMEKEHRFDEEDLAFLTALATQASKTIKSGISGEILRHHKNLDTTLFTITSQLRQATDIEQVMNISVTELAKALNAKRAIIELNVKPSSDVEAD